MNAAQVAGRLLGRPVRVVGELRGGQHARTTLVTDGDAEFVLRVFPPGDGAVAHEVTVLPRLASLVGLVPQLVGYDVDPSGPAIVTTWLSGGHPSPQLPAGTIARELAAALARVHAIDVAGRPLLHNDVWCGNALWSGDRLTGVVDWTSAGPGDPGRDVAWARLDLVLLGDPGAADTFVDEYERRSGRTIDVAHWDHDAAVRADPVLETWTPNYAGIGRPWLTPDVLRSRFDRWRQRPVGTDIARRT